MSYWLNYSQLEQAFILLSIYQFKHFICDFPLQRPYMLNKIRDGWDFVLPLSLHCFVHAIFTFALVWLVRPDLWWLGLVDFFIHFVMDRLKAGRSYLGRYRDKTKAAYWNSLGFDQMIHHLTHIYIVWVMVH